MARVIFEPVDNNYVELAGGTHNVTGSGGNDRLVITSECKSSI